MYSGVSMAVIGILFSSLLGAMTALALLLLGLGLAVAMLGWITIGFAGTAAILGYAHLPQRRYQSAKV